MKEATSLSIVIVNYNVRYFIIKCLESIYKANHSNFKLEVIVVDNASVDGSCAAIKEKFPETIIIENKINVGFAKANNQGFKISKGDYILALNPDTILQEDTLTKSIEHMLSNKNYGVCGVKMIDGSGNYLPESKRGLPTLWNSICKFSGLSSLFPNSEFFSGYYMGHLSEDQNHIVEVLCGAFMLFDRKVLLGLGGFDEDYFMYGEDIDLSQRIKQSGYAVTYLSTTRIIHFKGESTKKASFNYIKNFYSAMLIYVGKHYRGFNGGLMKSLIYFAIFFSAVLSYFKNNLLSNLKIVIDLFVVYYAIKWMRRIWANHYFGDENYFNNQASFINSISYVVIMIACLWFFGHYDKNWKPKRLATGVISGFFISLLIYALLPSSLRSSRALLILGSIATFIALLISKNVIKWLTELISKKASKNYILVASKENSAKISEIIINSDQEANIIGTVSPFEYHENEDSFYINKLSNLSAVIKTMKPEHVVFSNADLSLQKILDLMIYPDKEVKYLITGGDDNSVIGSESKNKRGNLFFAESSYKLSQSVYLRLKRLIDISLALISILLLPLVIFTKASRLIIPNVFSILAGSKTWVGYSQIENTNGLPKLKTPIFSTDFLIGNTDYYPPIKNSEMANTYYAKMYSVIIDLKIIYKGLVNGN